MPGAADEKNGPPGQKVVAFFEGTLSVPGAAIAGWPLKA